MPSFSDFHSHMLKGTFLKSKLHYQCAMSLQVPCILPLINIVFILGKRVLPFISGHSRRVSASMTVEAALCLPLWLFFAAALMEPVRWLDRQRQVQTALECFSEELSQAVYLGAVRGLEMDPAPQVELWTGKAVYPVDMWSFFLEQQPDCGSREKQKSLWTM